jgi:hypothetical protein
MMMSEGRAVPDERIGVECVDERRLFRNKRSLGG